MLRSLLAVLGVCVALAPAVPARADVIVFKSGLRKVGLIESETPETIRFRTRLGTTGISRDFIAQIERGTPEENAALQRYWAEEAQAAAANRERQAELRRAREQEQQAFEEVQRAKGLVKFDDEWLTPHEAELRLRRRQQELQAGLDRRVGGLEARLEQSEGRVATLERENARLREEVESLLHTVEDKDRTIDELTYSLERCDYYWWQGVANAYFFNRRPRPEPTPQEEAPAAPETTAPSETPPEG